MPPRSWLSRHPGLDAPDWAGAVRRMRLWGGLLPVLALFGLALAIVLDRAWLLLPGAVLGLFVLNAGRLYLRRSREGLPPRLARASAVLLMVGKLAEYQGARQFERNRARGRRSSLIEYKGPA